MKVLNKISLLQIMRRLIQLISFILLPGLFISIFSAIKDVYIALIGGSFSFSTLSYQLLLLIAVIPFTMLFGRFFCGFFCTFGAMGDLLWFIAGKVRKRRIFISKRADSVLKALKYVLLAAIVMLTWTLGIGAFGSTASPWTIFGMYFTLAGWPSAAYLISVGTVLLLFIIIGSQLVERFFCRYLCPLGAIFSIISRPRLLRIKKPRTDCGACSLCSSACAMGIRLNETDQVSSGECINCFECVKVCPRQNVRVNPTPAVAASMAAAAMAGLYFVGTVSGCNSAGAQSTITATAYDAAAVTSSTAGNAEAAYQDGVYTGAGSGYRGETTVTVTVSSGTISDISVVSTSDDERFINRAESSVISSIISKQSINVSTVSGATFSSNGIIEAVANALSIEFSNPNSTLPKHAH